MKVPTTPPSLPNFESKATQFSLPIPGFGSDIIFAVDFWINSYAVFVADFCIGSDIVFAVDF
jgi:hypothetical protein